MGDYLQKAKKTNDFRSFVFTQLRHGTNLKKFAPYKKEIEDDSVFSTWNGEKLPWGVFSTTDLAVWFVWRINEVGLRSARADLRRLKKTKTLTGKYIAPLIGYRSTKAIKIIGEYRIEPFEDLPIFDGKIQHASQWSVSGIPSDSKKAIGRNESGGPIDYGYKGICALTYTLKYKIGTPHKPEWSEISDELYSIAILASSLEDTRMSVRRMIFTTLDSCPFGMLSSGSSETKFGTSIGRWIDAKTERYQLDIKKLRELYKFAEKNAVPNHVAGALYYLLEAKFKTNDVEAYLYLGMALEIGLAHGIDDANKDSISSTIRRRAAWLVGVDYDDRQRVFMQIRDIYALRSSAVHTGSFDRKKKKLANRKEHQNLCSRILVCLLLKGNVDFDRMVLGG